MENDVKLNSGGDTLGEDNAHILAAKRERLAREQAAVSAGQLRAQMQNRPAPQPQAKTSAVPARAAAQQPRTASVTGRPTEPAAPHPPVRRPAQVPAQGQPAARPAQAPVQGQPVRRPAQAPVQGQPAARPAQVPAQMGQTTRIPAVRPKPEKKPEPTAASLGGAAGVHTLIPHQQAAAAPKAAVQSEETRITDMRSAPPADATRISNVQPPVKKKKVPEKKKEEEDESEGSNAIISIIKAVTYIVAVIVVSVFLAMFIVLVGNDMYAFVKSEDVVEVTIPEYATVNDISVILHENGLIEYPTVFKLYTNYKMSPKEKAEGIQFVAGTYAVTPMMNYDEFVLAFKPKKPTGTSRITIPEGYTTDQIINLFVSKGIGTREGYVEVINHHDFDYWFIDELETNGWKDGRYYRLDGYLFPDTYEFYNASSEEVVIGKLLRRFNEVFVDSYAQKAKDLGYTVDEILTLASMIEKEGGTQSDFFNISSVFNNRLKNSGNYPYLESDATIVYAIAHETGEHVNPTLEHTTYETPYNTYTNTGLPPGPIANPSASAIRAALYPADTEYYYFYSVSPTVTLYARTYTEHLQNSQSGGAGAEDGQ